MSLLLHWLVYALAILLAAYLLPGVRVSGLAAALVTSLVLGLINVLIRPILILLTLPLTVLTLGFFILVINSVLILLTSAMVPGFEVRNFWWALLFGIILSLINMLLMNLAFGP